MGEAKHKRPRNYIETESVIPVMDHHAGINMINVGDTISLGIFSTPSGTTEPLEWYVVKRDGDRALVVSRNVERIRHTYATTTYSLSDLDTAFYGNSDVRWKDSELRRWLNDDFYNGAFSSEEKKCIIDT